MICREYERWSSLATDREISRELSEMRGDTSRISDAFYRSLEFGTGGLRGILGAGTNRMNLYTVTRASVGFAKYALENSGQKIVIGYDTRINSHLFAKTAATVFASFGLRVYMYSEPLPTPMLSYAVRELSCFGGIMITASHNPSKYNGYKVYGSDGCQITDRAAGEILSWIEQSDYFDLPKESFEYYLSLGMISMLGDDMLSGFVERVKKTSQLFGEKADRSIKIVYTPLNGTGRVPVLKILSESGFSSVTEVREQSLPDGNFPTCPYPNPELPEALSLGLEYAKRTDSDILLATDPDSDRVGVAVRCGEGYRILTGNEVGLLLLEYISSQRSKHSAMPKDPVAIKTIVTTDLAERIAEKYGVKVFNVLTGFKYIGEKIGELEAAGRQDSYIFGFEESCGYLGSDYVRDKDGVYAVFLFSEMAAYCAAHGKSVLQKLDEIYREYGYASSSLYSYTFEGAEGFEKMKKIMSAFRGEISSFGSLSVTSLKDYSTGIDGLPRSDVLKFSLSGGSGIVVRPSGTEPKIKIYISVTAEDEQTAKKITEEIKLYAEKFMK